MYENSVLWEVPISRCAIHYKNNIRASTSFNPLSASVVLI